MRRSFSALALLMVLTISPSAAQQNTNNGLGNVIQGPIDVFEDTLDTIQNVLPGQGTGVEPAQNPTELTTGQDNETSIQLPPRKDSSFNDEQPTTNLDALDGLPAYDPTDNEYKGFGTGACYNYNNEDNDGVDDKSQRVFANSFALETSNGRGRWIDPDDTPATIKRGGTSCDLTQNDYGIVRSNKLLEEGGSNKTLTFAQHATIAPLGEDLCIGMNCPRRTGRPTSVDTDDSSVDVQGDGLNGTLKVAEIQSSTGTLCIGENCEVNRNPGDSVANYQTQITGTINATEIAPRTANLNITGDATSG